jgi:hypothetical protein
MIVPRAGFSGAEKECGKELKKNMLLSYKEKLK